MGQNRPKFRVHYSKKYTSSKKSTLPLVVAVVTNMSYDLRSEDEEILRYISNNGAFSMVGGRSLWQKIEEERVLSDCSSRGMMQRFERIIMKTIRTYGPE